MSSPSGRMFAIFSVPMRLLISLSMPSATPGYWIFMATDRPSGRVARCTWPMDAAAKGRSSNDVTNDRQSDPNWSTRAFWGKKILFSNTAAAAKKKKKNRQK